jgi:hypothetical protein
VRLDNVHNNIIMKGVFFEIRMLKTIGQEEG